MNLAAHSIAAALAASTLAYSQAAAPATLEFEVASIKPAAPQSDHFRAPGAKGGPGTADPGRFTCATCTLSYLISKAFTLERYQFPGQSSLPDVTFDLSARVPEGTTQEQFAVMLQNLLKTRFGLAYHFEAKQLQGYELVVAKNGPKLTESKAGAPRPAANDPGAHGGWAGGAGHSFGSGGDHDLTRPGFVVIRGQAKYRGEQQTTGDLARMIAAQLSRPVDDHTGLTGKYDISLTWSDDGAHAATHAGGVAGSWDHGDHGGPSPAGAPDTASGPTLFAAVQAQLGLKLEARKAAANIFIVDHVEKSPTGN
jgi:uncharacterized protein (TIGR03435 family)